MANVDESDTSCVCIIPSSPSSPTRTLPSPINGRLSAPITMLVRDFLKVKVSFFLQLNSASATVYCINPLAYVRIYFVAGQQTVLAVLRRHQPVHADPRLELGANQRARARYSSRQVFAE